MAGTGAAPEGPRGGDPVASSSEVDAATEAYGPIAGNRWVQLVAGICAMIVISNYQYAFTLFTPSLKQQFPGVAYAQIALIFSLFILFETWPMPVSGYFVDKFGIRKLMTLGAAMIGLGWFLGGTVATSVTELCLYYGVLAGTGAGIIYISCTANAVKWFPDRRGLAAGLTAAGFGGGAALTIIPIARSIASAGWAKTMAGWGIAQGVVAFLAALVLRHPPAGWAPRGWTANGSGKALVQSRANFTPAQVLVRPEFYLLFAMFVFAMLGGMMATANMSQIARTLGLGKAVLFGVALVPLTATTTSVCNAFARILWGTASDKLGRENTMAIAFSIEAVLVYLVPRVAGTSPLVFLLLFSLVFLFWGEVFSLFSAITGDVFGSKNASANYGMLYMGKGVGSVLAGYGAAVMAALFGGSFSVPFYASSILCLISASLALFAVKPIIRKRIAKEEAAAVAAAATAPAVVGATRS